MRVRHPAASICSVSRTQVLITIEDDGAGFDPGEPATVGSGGLGLVGIRERVAQLQGTLRLESASGKGTRLTVELPAQQPANMTDRADRARRRGALTALTVLDA